jgi:hypothetical protein
MMTNTLLAAAMCFVLAGIAFRNAWVIARRTTANHAALGRLYRLHTVERLTQNRQPRIAPRQTNRFTPQKTP